MKPTALVPVQTLPLAKAQPTLSEALAEFLGATQPKVSTPRGHFTDVEFEWLEYDRESDAETASRVMRGYRLARIQAASERDFQAGLKARGETKSSAYELIGVFNLFNALPNLSEVRAIEVLDFTKQRLIAAWGPLDAIALAKGESVRGITIDQAADMTSRELLAATKPTEVQELELDLEEAQQKIAGLTQIVANLRNQAGVRVPTLPPAYGALRDESVFLTTKMNEEVSRLASEARRLLIDKGWRDKPDSNHRMAVAGHLYHSVLGVVVMASELLEEIHLTYGKYVTGDLPDGAQYGPDEKEHLLALRAAAMGAAEAGVRQTRAKAMQDNGVQGKRPRAK